MPPMICHVAEDVKMGSAPRGFAKGTVRPVAKKTAEDLEAEARIRGHLRQQVAERKITPTELARRIRADSGNITRILAGTRGIKSLGQVLRICRGLGITATRLLEEDAAPEYRDESQSPDGEYAKKNAKPKGRSR
jgi:transcriptional regulator with XRE-family HTH domain